MSQRNPKRTVLHPAIVENLHKAGYRITHGGELTKDDYFIPVGPSASSRVAWSGGRRAPR